MRIISVITAAGSSGKSTTVATIATLLALQGRAVAVIDADPQADASAWFGIEDADAPSVASVVLGHTQAADALVERHGVQILPASGLDMTHDLNAVRDRPHLLGTLAAKLSAAPQLRDAVVIVDCPGTISDTATYLGALAADRVITCTYAGVKEAKGIADVMGLIQECPAQSLSAVVPCAVPAPSRHAGAQANLQALVTEYDGLVTPPVRWSQLVEAARQAHEPLPIHAPRTPVTRDYVRVVEHLSKAGVIPA